MSGPDYHGWTHGPNGTDPTHGGYTELYVGTAQSAVGFGTTTLDWAFAHGPGASETLLDLTSPTQPEIVRAGVYAISIYAWAANTTWDSGGYWQLVFNVLTNVGFWFPSIDGVPTDPSPGHAIPIISSVTAAMDAGGTIELQVSNRDSHTRDFQLKQAAITQVA